MNQATPQKLLRALACFSFGLSALFVILARVYAISCSDIVMMYTAWPEILEILINILECIVFGLAYGILIYAAYRFPDTRLSRFVLVYFGSVLFKYLANYLVTWITDTGMSADYLIQNLLYILLFTALEIAQAALVLLILQPTMKAYHAFIRRQQRIAAALPDAEVSVRTYAFPFSSLISLKNPLQKCAFWSGIWITVFKIASRMIYDFSYGLPTSIADAFWIVIYYLLDIFSGFAVCLLITYLLMTLDSREHGNAK